MLSFGELYLSLSPVKLCQNHLSPWLLTVDVTLEVMNAQCSSSIQSVVNKNSTTTGLMYIPLATVDTIMIKC